MRRKPLRPMAEIVAHQHFEGGGMALAALFERHRQGAIDGVADAFRIVRIDQQTQPSIRARRLRNARG